MRWNERTIGRAIFAQAFTRKHVVLLPIYRNDEEKSAVVDYCRRLASALEEKPFSDGKVQVEIDARDIRGGEKKWIHIKRGVPIRLEIGPRDVQADAVFMARRDLPSSEKSAAIPRVQFVGEVAKLLDEMQTRLGQRGEARTDAGR